MKHWLLQTIFVITFVLVAVIIDIIASTFLSFPFSKVNILFSALILLIVWKNQGYVVWFAFFSHFFLELFLSTPFGVVLFSSTISILLSYWMFRYLFTNRSVYAVATLSVVSLACYRILYIFLLMLIRLVNEGFTIPFKLTLVTMFWEILITASLTSVAYMIFSVSTKMFSTKLIR